MGSEHYCLRWNNHQSNLLGVFSQLLQDESLVDVTLACSEGAPIRAHKVVLSACSSYFQSLFLDHPERHPIVILKDVRFAELQTLVEFMYKGEVNVQYCQLSALLKTAESLKVKGLAEMTNQNTTLREPEREPDRLRPHSQPGKTTCASPVDAGLAGPSSSSSSSASSSAAAVLTTAPTAAGGCAASSSATHPSGGSGTACAAAAGSEITTASSSKRTSTTSTSAAALNRDSGECCSPSPPKRLLASSATNVAASPVPLDLYQRRSEVAEVATESARPHASDVVGASTNQPAVKRSGSPAIAADLSTAAAPSTNKARTKDEPDSPSPARPERPPSISLQRVAADDIEDIEDIDDDYDEEMDDDDDDDDDAENSSHEIGLNLKNIAAMVAANTAAGHASASASAAALVLPRSPLNVAAAGGADNDAAGATTSATASSTIPADLTQRPASRSSRDGGVHCSSDRPGSSGVYTMPSSSAHGGVGGDLSPNSAATAVPVGSSTSVGEPIAGASGGLGPVQSVPLSLKKEIDCSEDDNSNSRHLLLQPRSASASGGLGGGGGGGIAELDYRPSHESLIRNFGHHFAGAGIGVPGSNASTIAAIAARCPTPFAFPFSPLGLGLFDIDPSRILNMLHHQTWLAEEAMRTSGLLPLPKELPQRFATLNDLLSKEYQAQHLGLHHPLTGDSPTTAATPSKPQQQTHRSNSQQQMYKQQQQQSFNIRYPSSAAAAAAAAAAATATAFVPQTQQQPLHHHNQHQQQHHHHHHHHQHQQRQPQQNKSPLPSRQNPPSPLQTATSTQSGWSPKELKRQSEEIVHRGEFEADNSEAANERPLTNDDSGHTASITGRESNSSSSTNTPTSSVLYKNSLEQLLQRRPSNSALADGRRSVNSYSQLLLTASCSTTETSSCKEKSSSSSTSSTPPLALLPQASTTAVLLAHQQQQLQQHQIGPLVKSPSAESSASLFSETGIEEETRCVVCNAHFPNVWLLEQHAALQHPHLGPGEEKPFICEQCGQSYRYRSAYAKHKEQNHRARLPADKLFTCDVCGMQFRYLKSFKKHRLNHALERLHGKKIGPGSLSARLPTTAAGGPVVHLEQDIVTSSQELNALVGEGGEDLRINIKREKFDEEQREEEQDNTVDSAGGGRIAGANCITGLLSDNGSAASTTLEPTISSSDVIHSTNKRPRLLATSHIEKDPSYNHHLQRHHFPHAAHHQVHQSAAYQTPTASTAAAAAAAALNSLHSINSITSLINAERLTNEQFLGLNSQEASILNFLRVDAAERQRDKRSPQASRFACPFCGKCVRSKENLKLHVRKHTGERPFVCLFCGRAFGGKSDLTRHLRIHTGERPYHCESCGKCFARADYLSKHLTTHIHNAPR